MKNINTQSMVSVMALVGALSLSLLSPGTAHADERAELRASLATAKHSQVFASDLAINTAEIRQEFVGQLRQQARPIPRLVLPEMVAELNDDGASDVQEAQQNESRPSGGLVMYIGSR